MTREEAKKYIKSKMCYGFVDENDCSVYFGSVKCSDNCKIMEAIEVLEQEPCEDAISRSNALDAFGHGTTYTSEDLQRIIKALPSVNPQSYEELDFVQPHKKIGVSLSSQPKTGHWITTPQGERCSNCLEEFRSLRNYSYCPNCGCRMVEPQESEEV